MRSDKNNLSDIIRDFKKYTSSAIYKAIVKRVEKMVVAVIKKRKWSLVLGGGVSWRRNY
jgi:hypothetical protein